MDQPHLSGSPLGDLSLPETHSPEKDSGSDDYELTKKRHKRRIQSRKYAKTARKKKKEKIHLLESQIAELAEEAHRLSVLAAGLVPSFPRNKFSAAVQVLNQSLTTALANPQTTDEELDELLDKGAKLFEKDVPCHVEALTNAFLNTVDMMLPTHVKFNLWVCGLGTCLTQLGPVNWEELAATSNLSTSQVALIQEKASEQEKAGLKESFQKMMKLIEKIIRHAQGLHSMLTMLKDVLRPRQAAAFILWIFKNYSFLDTDRVLSYGLSSIDVLNSE